MCDRLNLDAMAIEVVRSGDLISYTGEEGMRRLGEGKMLMSDAYPGQDRSKLCLSQKVRFIAGTCNTGYLVMSGAFLG